MFIARHRQDVRRPRPGAQQVLVPAGRRHQPVHESHQGAVRATWASARRSSYAIDRQEISKKAEYGYVQPASQTGLVLPGQKAWLPPQYADGAVLPYDAAQGQAAVQGRRLQVRRRRQAAGQGRQADELLLQGAGRLPGLDPGRATSSRPTSQRSASRSTCAPPSAAGRGERPVHRRLTR